jgi:threonylcarbamoyladenosine tRNA methylthiotransferase MtaB
MPNQIEHKVKQARNQRMLELSRTCRRGFCEQFLGQTMPVLWEQETGPGSGTYSGLTGNYIRVFAHSAESLSNEITLTRLVESHNQGVRGEIVNENPS